MEVDFPVRTALQQTTDDQIDPQKESEETDHSFRRCQSSQRIELTKKRKVQKRKQRQARKLALASSGPEKNSIPFKRTALSDTKRFLAFVSQEYEKGNIKLHDNAIGKADEYIRKIMSRFKSAFE